MFSAKAMSDLTRAAGGAASQRLVGGEHAGTANRLQTPARAGGFRGVAGRGPTPLRPRTADLGSTVNGSASPRNCPARVHRNLLRLCSLAQHPPQGYLNQQYLILGRPVEILQPGSSP